MCCISDLVSASDPAGYVSPLIVTLGQVTYSYDHDLKHVVSDLGLLLNSTNAT